MGAIPDQPGRLIVTADDWGYSARINAGIEQAARAGAIDAVSAMALRPACDRSIAESGVEVGLHLELAENGGGSKLDREPRRQADTFGEIFGRPPAYIDGHHHAHAAPAAAAAVEALARQLSVPVRSVSAEHRRRLRGIGIATNDRITGRMSERDPVLPDLLAAAMADAALPPGITEWVVHPGQCDPGSGSAFDRGREEDLALLLELAIEKTLAEGRTTHLAALGGEGG